MLLERLLDNNRQFRRHYQPPPPAQPRWLVVADSDASLSGLLEPALGLEPGQVIQVRLAGAWAGDNGEEILRSALLALHLNEIEAVLVVGAAESSFAPADELRLRRSLRTSGLADKLLDGGKQLRQRLQGPGDIVQAVQETGRLLRERVLPPEIPVFALLLDSSSGGLQVLELAPPEPQTVAAHDSVESPPEPETAPGSDIPLPELPDIELPEIPPLDLDALLAQPAASPTPPKPRSEYGQHNRQAGPVTFEELASMNAPPPQPGQQLPEFKARQLQIEGVGFVVPEAVKVADTGLPEQQVEISEPPAAPSSPAPQRRDLAGKPDVQARASVQPRPGRARPRPSPRRPERPETTPLVSQRPPPTQPPQVPLRERVLDFDDGEKTPVPSRRNIRADLNSGYVQVEGSDLPLDPRLQMALLKLKQFLARELDRHSLEQLARGVRHKSLEGLPVGELLKLVITPVLRLGKKRYAVINDLLTIKEQLPRLEGRIAAVLLEDILAP